MLISRDDLAEVKMKTRSTTTEVSQRFASENAFYYSFYTPGGSVDSGTWGDEHRKWLESDCIGLRALKDQKKPEGKRGSVRPQTAGWSNVTNSKLFSSSTAIIPKKTIVQGGAPLIAEFIIWLTRVYRE